MLKIGGSSTTVSEFFLALQRGSPGILLLFVIILFIVLIFGCIMYFVETLFCSLDEVTLRWMYDSGPLKGEETDFQNVMIGMWWAVVTVTTVSVDALYCPKLQK